MHRFDIPFLAPNVLGLNQMEVLQIVDAFFLDHDDCGKIALGLITRLVYSHVRIDDLHSGHPVQWDQLFSGKDANVILAENLLRLCIALFELIKMLLLVKYTGHPQLLLSEFTFKFIELLPFEFHFCFDGASTFLPM